MIVSEASALTRLQSPDNLINKIGSSGNGVVKEFRNGKVICHEGGGRVTKLPEIKKRIIVGLVNHGESPKAVAEVLGISRQAATNISNGKTANGLSTDKEMEDFIAKSRSSASELAIKRTMEAFNLMSVDKMSKASAKDLSVIAKNSADVLAKLNGDGRSNDSGVKVMIYAPTVLKAESYDTVEVD